MDALKFVRETNRMCKSFGDSCEDCPANDVNGCMVDQLYEEIVPIVEKWAKQNPRKTRQDVFLEQWPETTPDEHGVMRWIPVTERLPMKGEDGRRDSDWVHCIVSVIWTYGSNFADAETHVFSAPALFDVDQKIWHVGSTDESRFSVNALIPLEDSDGSYFVTHWMPYPEPPQEGRK